MLYVCGGLACAWGGGGVVWQPDFGYSV